MEKAIGPDPLPQRLLPRYGDKILDQVRLHIHQGKGHERIRQDCHTVTHLHNPLCLLIDNPLVSLEDVKIALEWKCDPNLDSQSGTEKEWSQKQIYCRSPVQVAVESKRGDVLQVLLDAKAAPTEADLDKLLGFCTRVHCYNSFECMQTLIKAGALLNVEMVESIAREVIPNNSSPENLERLNMWTLARKQKPCFKGIERDKWEKIIHIRNPHGGDLQALGTHCEVCRARSAVAASAQCLHVTLCAQCVPKYDNCPRCFTMVAEWLILQ